MRNLVVIGSFAALLLVAGRAGATDANTFKCESKAADAVGKWGAARGTCLVKCDQALVKKGPTSGLVCTPPFDTIKTQPCVDKADAKYTAAVVKACPSGTFPTCGGYATFDPTTYADEQITQQSAAIDPITVPWLMCDDTQVKCEGKVVGTLGKLSGAIGKCLGKCYQKSQVKGDMTVTCTPQGGSDPFGNLDTVTKGCVDTAIGKANASITKACPTLPACGPLYPLGQSALVGLVTGSIAGNYSAPASNPYCAP